MSNICNEIISAPGYCETYFDTFESLCSNIAGDSPMHTMFRYFLRS